MKVRLRLHLLLCVRCRRYVEQLRIIGAAAKDRFRNLVVDTETLSRLEKSILDNAFGDR
jgi:hypothetical protein